MPIIYIVMQFCILKLVSLKFLRVREREKRERERGGRVKRRPRAYGPKALYEPNRAGHSVRV